jgi:membrane protease YdiL (CAAX protease family)
MLPGICEELLFRGVILTGLRRSFGPVAAVAVSALLFAALHASPWRFFPQLLLGVLLALLTLRSGSVLPAVVAHAAYNASAYLIARSHERMFGDAPSPPVAVEGHAGGLAVLALIGLMLCALAVWVAGQGRRWPRR